MTPAEGQMYGMSCCQNCQKLVFSLKHHWNYCKPSRNKRKAVDMVLPPGLMSRPQDDVDDSDVAKVDYIDGDQVSEIEKLYFVLQKDSATELEVEAAFEILSMLPNVRRMWKPLEVSVLNDCVTKLCQDYSNSYAPVKLLRLLSLVKVGASPLMTKHRFSRLRERLKHFPYLSQDDARIFQQRLDNKATQPRGSKQALAGAAHSRLAQGRVGLLEDFFRRTRRSSR